MTRTESHVIVGAGLCGLTVAERLADAGHDVTILERNDHVGGLAFSFSDDGFIFDVGPHYFFLNVRDDVNDYVRHHVQGSFNELGFRISAHFKGREIAWPPNLGSILKLPPRAVARYIGRIVRNQHSTDEDFRAFSSFLYGPAMYETFFGPYIQKKLPVAAGESLHRDWWILARRTIDNELDVGQDRYLRQLGGKTRQAEQGPPPLKKRLLKAADMLVKTWSNIRSRNLPRVLYPDGGIGMIAAGIADAYRRKGGKLILGAGNVSLTCGADGGVAKVAWDGGAILEPRHVVWTGTIHTLADLLGFEPPDLQYLSIALVYVKSRRPIRNADYLYTYYAEPDLVFNRLYFPTRASQSLAPPGMDSVGAEISPPGGIEGVDPEELGGLVVDGLVRLGHLDREDVLGVKVRFARKSYPVYPIDYQARLKKLWDQLAGVPNLTSLGRSGQFYYNNMALTMCAGLDLSRRLLGQPGYWEERLEERPDSD